MHLLLPIPLRIDFWAKNMQQQLSLFFRPNDEFWSFSILVFLTVKHNWFSCLRRVRDTFNTTTSIPHGRRFISHKHGYLCVLLAPSWSFTRETNLIVRNLLLISWIYMLPCIVYVYVFIITLRMYAKADKELRSHAPRRDSYSI